MTVRRSSSTRAPTPASSTPSTIGGARRSDQMGCATYLALVARGNGSSTRIFRSIANHSSRVVQTQSLTRPGSNRRGFRRCNVRGLIDEPPPPLPFATHFASSAVDEEVRLDLLELLHRTWTTHPTNAAALKATLLECIRENAPPIRPDGACFQPSHDARCAIDVPREDGRGQTINGRVRPLHGVVLVRKWLEAQHRPEDLVLDERHVERFGLELHRPIECSLGNGGGRRATATHEDLRVLRRRFDDLIDAIDICVIHERPHLARLLIRWTQDNALEKLREPLAVCVRDGPMHENARASHAELAIEPRESLHDLGRDRLNGSVVES